MLAGELRWRVSTSVIVERLAQPGYHRLARGRAAFTHHRGARSTWNRRPVPLRRDRRRRSPGSPGVHATSAAFPTRHPYGLGLWQNHIEGILAGWVRELKVPTYYGVAVTDFAQDDTGVDVFAVRWPIISCAVSHRLRRRLAS